MHHAYLDKLAYGDSAIHRLDARIKLGVVGCLVLAVALTPLEELWRLAFLALFLTAILVTARLPFLYLLRRSLLVLPFVFAVGALLPFREGGRVLIEWRVFGRPLAVRDEGLHLLLGVATRSYVAVWALLLLASTTRFHRLLAALQAFGLPRQLAVQLSFLYRYLFVVAGEALRMRRARDARMAGFGHRVQDLQAAGGIVGVLFLRTYERSERIYQAMAARGFDGTIRLASPLHLHGSDWLALLVGLATVAASATVPFPGCP